MNKADIFPSRYLSCSDIPEEGATVTIRAVTVERMQDGAEKPIASFVEKMKDMIINVTKWNTIAKLYGDESDDWLGKRITIVPGTTKFRGEIVPCIDVVPRKPGVARPIKAAMAKAPDPLSVTDEDVDDLTDEEAPPF